MTAGLHPKCVGNQDMKDDRDYKVNEQHDRDSDVSMNIVIARVANQLKCPIICVYQKAVRPLEE